jgi:glycosyltransferase involved in cell wall biosynthesis
LPSLRDSGSSGRRIRVLQVTHDLRIGGLQSVVVALAGGLDRDRYEVSVCALRGGGPLESQLAALGNPVFLLPRTGPGPDYFSFAKLSRIVAEVRPDVIHTHNTHPFIDGTIAKIWNRVPVQVHTDHGRLFPDRRRYMFAEWVLSHLVDRVVAVCEAGRRDLVRYERLPASRLTVIVNGLDPTRYRASVDLTALRAHLGIGERRSPILGWCGRLAHEKGLTYLIRAVVHLRQDFPDLLAVLVGEGELRGALESEIRSLGVESHFLFLGARSDVPALMRLFDVFALPSLREGLPLVLLEAMAASVPVVATSVGGNPEVIRDGATGLLVPPCDPVSLAAALGRILSSRELRSAFTIGASHVFDERFTLDRTVSSYQNLYEELLAQRGKGRG